MLLYDSSARTNGVGNLLDGLSESIVMALLSGRQLLIRSPQIATFCTLVGCRFENATDTWRVSEIEKFKEAKFHSQTALAAFMSSKETVLTSGTTRYKRIWEHTDMAECLYEVTGCASNDLQHVSRSGCVHHYALRAVFQGAGPQVRGSEKIRNLFVGNKKRYSQIVSGKSIFRYDVAIHLRLQEFLENPKLANNKSAFTDWLDDSNTHAIWECFKSKIPQFPGRRTTLFLAADFEDAKEPAANALSSVADVEYFVGFGSVHLDLSHLSGNFDQAHLGVGLDFLFMGQANLLLSLRGLTPDFNTARLTTSFGANAARFSGPDVPLLKMGGLCHFFKDRGANA